VSINKNINHIESAAIGLSALGTIAAVVTQQIAYIATPLTLALSLSLINRHKELAHANRRLANLEQQFASEIESVVKQSQTIQAELHAFPATTSKRDFEKLVKTVSADRQELKRLSTALSELEQRGNDLVPFLTEIDLTKDSLKQLSSNFSSFEKEFDRRQGGINNRSAEREFGETRSNNLNIATIETIDRDPQSVDLTLNILELDTNSIYLSIAQIKSKIQLLEDSSKVSEDAIKQVGWRFLELEQSFSERQDPISITALDRSIVDLQSSIDLMSADFSTIQTDYRSQQTELTTDRAKTSESIARIELDIRSLTAKSLDSELEDRVIAIDASLGDLHDYNLRLNNQIESLTQYEISEILDAVAIDERINALIKQQALNTSQKQFEIIKQLLPKQYNYDLVVGRSASRQILITALEQSQDRLILVCPWLTKFAVNTDIENLMTAALDRGVSIEIGWGHLNDADNNRATLSKEKILKSSKRKYLYNAIPWIYQLQTEYPDLLTIKVLGTHEKFLVCDRQFAMLGSHNYLTSNTSSSEREVGLKTDSPEIIDRLIELFDRAEA
jgi:PLD-like domain